jgi:hypothetical protein
MNSLKEFKAAFKVGDRWSCFNSNGWKWSTSKEVIRDVYKVQTNAVAFGSVTPGENNLSWLYWPKASEVTFIKNAEGDFSVRIENPVMGGYLIYRKAV